MEASEAAEKDRKRAMLEADAGRIIRSDVAGAFEFRNVRAGQYSLLVGRCTDFLEEAITPPAGGWPRFAVTGQSDTIVDVKLPQRYDRRLSGIVVDHAGQPVVGAKVSFAYDFSKTITNIRGEFALGGLPEGEIAISASKEDAHGLEKVAHAGSVQIIVIDMPINVHDWVR